MKKLPRIDALYWLMVISANTIGESGGDLISQSLGLGYGASTAVLVALFLVAVIVAVAMRVQHASIYWTVIILSSTAGTTMADFVTRELGLGYGWGSVVIIASLAIVFVAWRLVSPRESVDRPLSRITEILYWLAILSSSTLGTAFGDYIADGLDLGFGGGTLVLLGVLLLVLLMALFTKVPRDICYWLGIIVTHPLGATMGDYLTKEEGVNLGNLKATVLLASIFAAIVICGMLLRKKELASGTAASPGAEI